MDISVEQGKSLPAEESPPEPAQSSAKETSINYAIKWVRFHDTSRPILLQNENGPCPIIAIANVLSLRGDLVIIPGTTYLSSSRLVSLLAAILFDRAALIKNPEENQAFLAKIDTALGTFPSLSTGLDINVGFSDVRSFEYTSALDVFDIFKINLYHGWLASPQEDVIIASLIEGLTYNQVTDRILSAKSDDEENILRLKNFLESTSSQLTYYGLSQLSDQMNDGELAVLFRNNHYNTIYKNDSLIYLLATDVSYQNLTNFVWEVLLQVDGDNEFVNAEFKGSTSSESISHDIDPAKASMEAADRNIALQLQEEEQQACLMEERTRMGQRANPTVTSPRSVQSPSTTPQRQNRDICSVL